MNDRLRTALRSASTVRFLCSGNMVRSAFAELYARHLHCPLPVDSAATVYENEGLFPETRAALEARGVEPAIIAGFECRHLSCVPPTPDPGRVVFGMTGEHLEAWRAREPAHRLSFRLTELLGVAEDIPDPVLDGAPFDAVFEEVARCVEALVAELARGCQV